MRRMSPAERARGARSALRFGRSSQPSRRSDSAMQPRLLTYSGEVDVHDMNAVSIARRTIVHGVNNGYRRSANGRGQQCRG
jgi:hypothetical protein